MAFFIEIVVLNRRWESDCFYFFPVLHYKQPLHKIRWKEKYWQPIHLANVFLSNTSIGTVTNAEGFFTLDHFPSGRYDVVVSCIGYESYVTTVQYAQLPLTIEVNLKPRINILEEIVVEPYEKNSWEKYG